MHNGRPNTRRGSVLPLLACCLIALFTFVALAIDIGMLAVSRTQCQQAADLAALAGARTLNNKPGTADGNRANAIHDATVALTGGTSSTGKPIPPNYNLSAPLTAAQVTAVRAGLYNYDTASQQFGVSYPGTIGATQSWTAMEVVIGTQQPTYFMRVLGMNSMPSGARAVAVHRPRDIALVLDMTASMGYGSLVNIYNGINEPNAAWPAFGHYQRYAAYNVAALGASETDATVGSRPHPLRQTASAVVSQYVYAPANLTIETPNGKPVIRDFRFTLDAANLADPSVPASAPTFNPDGTSNLRNAFHRWSPGESGADPTNYVGPAYDFSGYDATHNGSESSPRGPTPAPDNFRDQSDSPIPFVGDKHPRKHGAATGPTWDATAASGAAVTAAEFLGWVPRYTGGSSLPADFPTTAPTGMGSPARDWTNFRDATWERYGYDLDVGDYVIQRGALWDPRWDWDKKANAGTGGWAHVRSADPSSSFRPLVTPGKFKGYTMGPQYWGKTFFVWPPDPRAPVGNPGDADYQPGDWRRRYFLDRTNGSFTTQGDNDTSISGEQTMNAVLLTNGTTATTNGTSRGPTFTRFGDGWRVNYPVVLRWIKSGPMVLPPNLRSGRVLYYSSIPNDVTASGSDSADVAADKVFWKAYIDFVLSTDERTPPGLLAGIEPLAGTEPVGWPEGVAPAVSQAATTAYDVDAGGPLDPDPKPYTNYLDNPNRPRLHLWFGPLTMLTFLNDYNMWSGTTHQAQCWQLKAGVNSALDDIRNNHPNDYCGLAYFSNADYNSIVVPTGQDWGTLKNALFFPRSLLPSLTTPASSAEVRPYTATTGVRPARGDIPNAQGGTDPVTGLSLAYNILSPSPFVNPDPLRRGRRGAAKIVIFETDGVPNGTRPFNLQKKGYDSYYLFGGTAPNTNPQGAAYDVVDQIRKPAAQTNAPGVDSGFSLPNAPARVYAVGFGDIFSTSAGPAAEAFLLNVQKRGGTSPLSATIMPPAHIITGPYHTRIQNLRTALERICQSGVQVTLIE